MASKAFFDANILLYSDDARFPSKQDTAAQLIESHLRSRTGAVSLQSLGEYFRNATLKLKLDPSFARQRAEFFARFPVYRPLLEDVHAAMSLYISHRVPYWDAMIVQAAIQSGCKTLYSEDLQHGRQINGIEIINPFL